MLSNFLLIWFFGIVLLVIFFYGKGESEERERRAIMMWVLTEMLGETKDNDLALLVRWAEYAKENEIECWCGTPDELRLHIKNLIERLSDRDADI